MNNILNNIDKNEMLSNIEILKSIGCNKRQIENIISSNPNYLSRIDEDIVSLIKKLYEIGLNNLNIIFDSNSYLLDKDAFEIDEYLSGGLTKEEIVLMIEKGEIE